MLGPTFIHFATYSRKANPGGNHIAQIIGEALRRPEFSHHVEDAKPPRVIQGTPETFEADHDAHVEERGTVVKRKGKTYRKAIRQDRHTLCTAVASYPLTHAQIAERGDNARTAHAEWEARTVAWMKERYGDQLRVVLAHDDEAHPHLHFWMLPDDQDARADTLHPGKVAKREAEALARGAGATDREAVGIGNEALKVAMRAVLDDYHRTVGEPLGLTRDGPKRRRLTRKEWQAEKQEAMRRAEALRRAEGAERVVEVAETKAAQIVQAAEAVEAGTVQKRDKFKEDAKAWVSKNKATLEDRKTELDQIAASLGVKAAEVEKDRVEIEKDRAEVRGYRRHLVELLDHVEAFLKTPGLSAVVRKAGASLMKAAGRAVPAATGQADEGGLRQRLGISRPASSATIEKPRPEAPSDDFSM